MALVIKNEKVVYVAPPKKLTDEEKKMLEETPVNKKLIKSATSRKYNVVQFDRLLTIKKHTSKNISFRLAIDILSDVGLSDELPQARREKSFIEDICRRIEKSSTVLYVLKDGDITLGFVALSVSSIGDFPSLQVDYLFVSQAYRGKPLKVLDDLKTSHYLVEFVIEVAKEIQQIAGLRYVVLLPDNDKLNDIYKNMGFVTLPKHEWLYVKL